MRFNSTIELSARRQETNYTTAVGFSQEYRSRDISIASNVDSWRNSKQDQDNMHANVLTFHSYN